MCAVRRVLSVVLASVMSIGLAGVVSTSQAGAATLPQYSLTYLGSGAPVAINNVDTVVGSRTDPTSGAAVPLVSTGGAAWTALPVPAGFPGAFPTDVNDSGVIVGVATQTTLAGRRAVRWTPSGGGYTAELLPLPAGEATSYATAVNNSGQVVGARAGILGTPFGFGWVYSDATGTQGLLATYGWDSAGPVDINDNGVILDGTQTFTLSTRTVADIGAQLTPPVGGVAINGSGQVLGVQSTSGSLPTVRAYRYTPGSGWLFITGTSRNTTASSINAGGDLITGSTLGGSPAVYLEGSGNAIVADLLDPAVRTAGWVLNSTGGEINDGRVITTQAQNTTTGASGAVLLRPSGTVQPPAAPTGLTAVAHPATSSEPYAAIILSWTNGDPVLTRSHELERSVSGQNAWTAVPLVPPAQATSHQDTTVSPGVTYDYRVRAIGSGGPSAWSGLASATAPPAVSVRVSDLTLRASRSGSRLTVTGVVTVRDQFARPVDGATVTVRWTLPNRTTRTASGVTSAGQATITTSGSRGTYTLTVTGVSKPGYVFDAAGSVLSRSIRG